MAALKRGVGLLFAYHTHLVFGGEVSGNIRGYLAGGQSFVGAVEGSDEPDALERLVILVALGGVKDFAFAVLEHHYHRLVARSGWASNRVDSSNRNLGAMNGS